MGFYGYNRKEADLSGIERAGQTIGGAIGQLPENIRNQKADEDRQAALQKAADMATKDWGSMETSAKAIKSTYQKKAKALIEQGLYTKEQLDEDMQLLPIPMQAHKKDVLGYMKNLGTNYNTLLDKLDKISSKQQTGQAVGEAVKGSPAGMEAVGEKKFIEQEPGKGFIEQDIQQVDAVPAATTQEEAAGRLSPEVTMEQAEQVPAFQTLPTQEDLTKRAQAKAKKTADTEMDALEREYKRAQIDLAKANKSKAYESIDKMKQDLLLKEQALQKVYDFEIVDQESKITKMDEEIKALKEGEEQLGGGILVDWDAINALERQKREKKRKISELDARSKGLGQKPGETRKFEVPGTAIGKPKPKPGVGGSEADIRAKLSKKWPQDKIDRYIAYRKQQGTL